MTQGFRLTERQVEANRLLGSEARHILLRGGSRSGKTFLLVRACFIRALRAPETRHAIFRFKRNAIDASIWQDTLPKVRRLCFPQVSVMKSEQDMSYTLPNGSLLQCGGLDDKDRVEKILGQEYATLYLNEVSQIPWPSVEMVRTRLAQKSELPLKAYYDCNPPPKSHWTYQVWKLGLKPGTKEPLPDRHLYAEMRINPEENRENLSPEYIDELNALSAARRLRFLSGEWGSDTPGALWTQDVLDRYRIGTDDYPELRRIVVAVDPPVSSGDKADECGIIVAGVDGNGHGYVLDDRTTKGQTPEQWAREVVKAYNDYAADRVVAEVNNGGELVGTVLRHVDSSLSYRAVRASKGKVTRAEPVSALYEEGRIHHCGHFPELEDQMCAFTNDFDPKTAGYSPDRVDALVWAKFALIVEPREMKASSFRI